MKKLLLLIPLLLVLVACGPNSGSGDNPVEVSQQLARSGEPTIISQDTYDRDNFSLIEAGRQMHESGKINLLAVDVTGFDTGGKGGLLFSTLLEGTEIPILVNHSPTLSTRVTPSSQRYSNIDAYPHDGLLDSQRQDSTLGLAEVLRASPVPVTYVVGGHLHNLADLMRHDMALVQAKIKSVVIVSGWTSLTAGRPEMNMSQGVYSVTGTSIATNYVVANLPSNIELVIADVSRTQSIDVNSLDKTRPLYYLLAFGSYRDKPLGLGDFNALLYAAGSPDWYGHVWYNKVRTCLSVKSYGALTAGADCGKNHFYLGNVNSGIAKAVLHEHIK